jgi:hypothetical protein
MNPERDKSVPDDRCEKVDDDGVVLLDFFAGQAIVEGAGADV